MVGPGQAGATMCIQPARAMALGHPGNPCEQFVIAAPSAGDQTRCPLRGECGKADAVHELKPFDATCFLTNALLGALKAAIVGPAQSQPSAPLGGTSHDFLRNAPAHGMPDN